MAQGHGAAQQEMTDEELQAKVVDIVRNLRSESRWALEQWLRLLEVAAIPGTLALQKPHVPGDPIEALFVPQLHVDTTEHFTRRPRKR